MITPNCFPPENTPVPQTGGQPQTPVSPKLKKSAKEFASVMAQTLHPKPQPLRSSKSGSHTRREAGASPVVHGRAGHPERPAAPTDSGAPATAGSSAASTLPLETSSEADQHSDPAEDSVVDATDESTSTHQDPVLSAETGA